MDFGGHWTPLDPLDLLFFPMVTHPFFLPPLWFLVGALECMAKLVGATGAKVSASNSDYLGNTLSGGSGFLHCESEKDSCHFKGDEFVMEPNGSDHDPGTHIQDTPSTVFQHKSLMKTGPWWHTPLIPALGRQRQADF